MRNIIIGDIHGCAEELERLLNKLDISSSDRLISIGDLLHKGPDEASCIEMVSLYSNEYVFGNHEEKQLRWEKHEDKREKFGKANPMSYVDGYKRLSESHYNWIRNNASMYITLTASGKNYILLHGGIEPIVRSLPSQNPASCHRGEMNILRTRYVNPKGSMVMLGAETEVDNYWADIYDGRFGHVIFGHQPFFQNSPKQFPHATGIDLGGVYGGYLCALVIEDTGATSYVLEPCSKYATHISEE